MKYIYIIIALFLTSCGDDFLDLQPESVADISDIYKTEDDFFQALIGAYDELQSGGQYGKNFQYLFESRADVLGESSAGFQDGIYFEIDRFLMKTQNPILKGSWGSLYQGIYRSNLIIEKLDESSLTAQFKNQIEAEVRFIRALSYFNIVKLWGDAPLIRKTISPDESLTVTRNESEAIYDFIISELIEVGQILPTEYDAANIGRATKYAAIGLLGKVYLDRGLYQEAADAFEDVISSGIYTLQDDPAQIFDLQNEWNSEILFAIRWKRQVEETDLFFGRASLPITVDQDYLDAFDAADTRLPLSSITTVGAYSVPGKYRDAAGSNGKTGMDFPVLRYADVLLMYAEALNELGYQSAGSAFDVLNEVRIRAGISELTSLDVAGQEAFRSALLDERRKELIYEGHAWFDLMRLGDPIKTLGDKGIEVISGKYVYPIPDSEVSRINNSGFQQNEAYN